MKYSVLISGASSGIGEATARLFAQNGYHVILLGRNENRLKKVTSEIKNSTYYCFDLMKAQTVQSMLVKIQAEAPYPISVLINNAGLFSPKPFLKTKEEDWQENFSVNLMGTVRLTKAILPLMVKNKKGSIINISSTLGLKPIPDTSVYSSFKAALINLTQTLALEFAASGVRINCICPGIVDTPIHSFHKLEKKEKQKALKSMTKLQPIGRIGTPEDVAQSIYFLASENSSWTTGAVLSVDGGINIKS